MRLIGARRGQRSSFFARALSPAAKTAKTAEAARAASSEPAPIVPVGRKTGSIEVPAARSYAQLQLAV